MFRTAPALALFGLLAGQPAPVRAEPSEIVYATPKSVLASFFPKSERVTYRTLALDAREKARLAHRLGYTPARDSYTVFVAMTQGKVDGYAVIDDELGLHQPITFATRLTSRGIVDRVEIMVYREPRGDEVRDPRFRKQFEGKSAADPLRIDRDIDAVSGATVSSASLATGVRRAAILVEELGFEASAPSTVAAARTPAPAPAKTPARVANGAQFALQSTASPTARP
jgi:Na+-translocating ferredoxin:NAD+ oxidoreductase subunit G